MKFQKIAAVGAILPLMFGVTACDKEKLKSDISSASHSISENVSPTGSNSSSSNGSSANGGNSGTPAGVGENPAQRGGNYYAVLGKATFDKTCNIPSGGYNYTGVLNGAGQVGAACAKVISKHKRVDPIDDPAGFSYNKKVAIPYVNGSGKAYHGYFYNRSHMISAALGGSPKAENLVTGTRTQNVGDGNKGGMRYTEAQAEKYIVSSEAKSCPLTYEVTPHYRNTTDAVPTWVEVNMQNCDKKIDEKVAVFNDANGFTIDYATGKWTEN